MRTLLKLLAGAVALLVLIVAVGLLGLYAASEQIRHRRYPAHAERLVQPTPAALADAPRQARLLGCLSCHGAGLRGHRVFDIPGVARVYAPNLTLIAGQRTDQQLAQAIRQGISADGRSLFVMPSRVFSRMTDDETAAMIAYVRGLPKGGVPQPATTIGLKGRLGLIRGLLKPEPEFVSLYRRKQPIDLGPAHAHGRHITATVCGECHGADLGGDTAEDGGVAPDLAVAGAYDLPAFTALMRTGKPIGGRDLGIMSETARDDLRMFRDEEIADLHAYLKARAEAPPPP